jgi:hypothetical protein
MPRFGWLRDFRRRSLWGASCPPPTVTPDGLAAAAYGVAGRWCFRCFWLPLLPAPLPPLPPLPVLLLLLHPPPLLLRCFRPCCCCCCFHRCCCCRRRRRRPLPLPRSCRTRATANCHSPSGRPVHAASSLRHRHRRRLWLLIVFSFFPSPALPLSRVALCVSVLATEGVCSTHDAVAVAVAAGIVLLMYCLS